MSDRFIMEVEGGLLHLYRREKVKTVSFDEALEGAAKDGWSSGILPIGCRVTGTTETGVKYYCVEQAPRLITVLFLDERGVPQYFRVSAAFIQYWITFIGDSTTLGRSYTTTTKRPLLSLGDILYLPTLPNLWQDGRVCHGTTEIIGNSQVDIVNNYIRTYSGRVGNNDLPIYWPNILKTTEGNLASFQKWHNESEKDPSLGLSQEMTYREIVTVDAFINRIIKGEAAR